MQYKLNVNDIKYKYFNKMNTKGGQKQQKTSNAVRATHIPTGIIVEASEARSQSANKKLAIEKLEATLRALAEKDRANKEAEAYNNKPEASFSSQIRTYKLCGKSQGVVDHRTGASHPNAKTVLDGNLDVFLRINND
jgi:peptide chain release factor 2